VCIHLKAGVGCASVGRDDHTFVQKCVGDRDTRLEQSARVVAQVQHQAG
jgi:hypothetical protein